MVAAASNTVYGIIRDAMHDAGLLQEGDDPNSEQLATYMRRLCDIINLWQTQGLKLFLQEEITVPMVAGQGEYLLNAVTGTFPSKHLRVLQARINGPGTSNRPIMAIGWDEWNRLPRGNVGSVTGYFVNKRANSLVVSLWNVPDANEAVNSITFLVHTQAANPYNLESDVAFPQEWRIALRWALADDISTGQPVEIMNRAAQRAEVYRQMLEDWDVEDTTVRFTPDFQGTYRTGGFR